jgi:predicted  nucleic acid-binding Zn-ribbon protein
MNKIMKVTIPVSVGELLDKISILEIKAFITDDEYIHKELNELNKIKSTLTQYTLEHEIQLKKINETLWKIEDNIRQKEQRQEFDEEFVKLARSVYITNDKRAELKRKINEETGSHYKEIKLY